MNCCEEEATGRSPTTDTSETSRTSASGSWARACPTHSTTAIPTKSRQKRITPQLVHLKTWTDEASTTITRQPAHQLTQTLVAWQQRYANPGLGLTDRGDQ